MTNYYRGDIFRDENGKVYTNDVDGQGFTEITTTAVNNQSLIAWVTGEAFELLTITYNVTDVMVMDTATVKWPDGSSGVFTTTAINTTWKTIDSFTITHADSGKTVTQTLVTRNVNGLITVKPALTVV